MSDPGRAYLYSNQTQSGHKKTRSWGKGPTQAVGGPGTGPSRHSNTQVLGEPQASHLLAPAAVAPPLRAAAAEDALAAVHRWEAAVGNLEDARVAFDVIARAVDDAVFLDEDAYKQIMPTMQYTVKIQAQQLQIGELEQQLEESNERLLVTEHACQEAQQQTAQLRAELENNAEVFKMHYTELLAKEDELSKLRVIVQALSES